MRIDLNADLGEGIGDDAALLAVVTSANIATGAHAGGGATLAAAVAAAAAHGVAIGAHPSYRDRAGFGRASGGALAHGDGSARADLVADLVDQVLLVAEQAAGHGRALRHVKAHGALYNEAVADPVVAAVVVEALLAVAERLGHPVAVMTQPLGALDQAARSAGLEVLTEGFADRGYLASGRLMPRDRSGALLGGVDTMVTQALALAEGSVLAVDGTAVELTVDSLCVHGDTPGAVRAARAIRSALEAAGWEVAASWGGSNQGLVVPSVVRAFGDRAWLVQPRWGGAPGTSWVLAMAEAVRRTWPAAMVEPGIGGVLVRLDELPAPPSQLAADLAGGLRAAHRHTRAEPGSGAAAQRVHDVPMRYDGPDLVDTARALGLTVESLVTRHGGARWTVAAVGFSPGFGYLTSEDPVFADVPRRADPRARVPRGSVALAAGMCAAYPSASPGGWQLVGSTDVVLFDPGAHPPALLSVGDVVRFRPVG